MSIQKEIKKKLKSFNENKLKPFTEKYYILLDFYSTEFMFAGLLLPLARLYGNQAKPIFGNFSEICIYIALFFGFNIFFLFKLKKKFYEHLKDELFWQS